MQQPVEWIGAKRFALGFILAFPMQRAIFHLNRFAITKWLYDFSFHFCSINRRKNAENMPRSDIKMNQLCKYFVSLWSGGTLCGQSGQPTDQPTMMHFVILGWAVHFTLNSNFCSDKSMKILATLWTIALKASCSSSFGSQVPAGCRSVGVPLKILWFRNSGTETTGRVWISENASGLQWMKEITSLKYETPELPRWIHLEGQAWIHCDRDCGDILMAIFGEYRVLDSSENL